MNVKCLPQCPAMCKVRLFYKSFKYDGKCYNCCGDCGCPAIVICMRRADVTAHIYCNRAEIVHPDDDTPLTEAGSCCQESGGCCD